MREAHPVERTVGIDYYVSEADGTGGRLRSDPADFRVREIEQFDWVDTEASPDAYPHLLLRCTLTDWDTNDFARALSDSIGISRERVSWAGTKDKRAISTQLVTIDGVEPDDLPDLTGVELEVVGRTGRPILFGDLAGNDFEITVSDPERPASVDEITSELEAFAGGSQVDKSEADLHRVGVPNYFGQQRFGSYRPVTHEVGLAILAGDWEGAVMAYVGNPSPREPEETQAARAFVDSTRDWQAALDRFPRHLGYERAMLHRLADAAAGAEADGDAGVEVTDFQDALETLPTNLQQLFVNAAQSYLFNRILSKRLAAGLPFHHPVEGDVVCFSDADAPEGLPLPDADRTQRVTSERLSVVTKHCDRQRAFVTAPLVGTETEFTTGEPGEITRSVLEEAGISRADFDLPGEFHSTGTRRAILVQTNLEYETDPLRFRFRLPKGAYATVLLREYCKVDPESL